ncbi:uncharacterized protein LOC144660733 isoform X2 [Oculina patagonica]
MYLRIVLLVAVMLQTSNVKGFKPCEYAHVMKCDMEFVAGFRTRPNDPDARVYCDVYQQFADCLSSSSDCKGEFIDSLRYIAFQRMIMDKTLGWCPRHDLEDLKEAVGDDAQFRPQMKHLASVGN